MESGVYTLKIIRVIRAKKQPDKLAVNPYNIPNMMKTLIHTLLPAALLLLTATACEDTLTTPAATIGHGDGPTLTLVLDNNEEKAGTRSTLNDGAPVNHVETVRILVFKGTGDDATYVGDEVYANEVGAIEWPDEKPDKITYRMNYAFVEGETYTLLGVGMDSHTDETITEPEEWNDVYDISLKKDETKLSEAYATLKADKTKEHIARHDFYTGTTTFTHEGKNTHIDDLLMKRRVAGVMLYVTEIPQKQTETDGDYRVTSIRVCLGGDANQKSSVRLQRDFENWDKEPDGQDELTGSNVIAEITGLDGTDWTYTDGQDFYMKDGKPATARTGVYMLPLNATDTPTFIVKMYGKKLSSTDTDGTTEGEEVELSKSFTVEQRDADGTSVTSFPIRSNYLYSIGKYNPEEGVDDPISLSGSPIYLEVLPFDELDVNHEFGEARVQALFNPDFDEETKIFNCMNTTISVEILPPLTTIRDRVKSININIDYNKTYAINDNGERKLLSDIINEKYESDALLTSIQNHYQQWIHMKDADGKYTNSLDITQQVLGNTENEPIKIEFLIRDYAMPREWGWDISQELPWTGSSDNSNAIAKIMDDIRDIEILMTTNLKWDSDGDGIEDKSSDRTDVLHISQYNTITVHYKNTEHPDDIAYCGFSREDLYDGTNEYYEDPYLFDWGFHNNANNGVYSNLNYSSTGSFCNGAVNYTIIGGTLTPSNWTASWGSSAAGRAEHLFRIATNGNASLTPKYQEKNYQNRYSNCWYLPAIYEIEGLMVMSSNAENPAKIKKDQPYWSSTLTDTNGALDSDRLVYACKFSTENGDKYETITLNRSNSDSKQNAYIRQARQFPEEYNYAY